MTIPAATKPATIEPNMPEVMLARFTFAVGETQSSRVNLGPYVLRAIRWPASGLTATSVMISVATTIDGPLMPLRDAYDTADWTMTVAAGRHCQLPTALSVGAGPVVALVGNVAQSGSDVTVEGILVRVA